MARSLSREVISTKREKIAKLAREKPKLVLTTLAHNIDVGWLREAYRRTRKDGAVGVDGVTSAQYETNLEENLTSFSRGSKRESIERRRYAASTFPKKVQAIRPGPLAYRHWRIRYFSERWSWSWNPYTRRTSWTARMGSVQVAASTRQSMRCGGG